MRRIRPRHFCRALLDEEGQYALRFDFTGEYQQEIIIHGGVRYRLIALLSDGTLALDGTFVGDVWMCGGGSGGEAGYNTYENEGPGRGGCGGYVQWAYGMTLSGEMDITIGAGGAGGMPQPDPEKNLLSLPPGPGGMTRVSGIGQAAGGTIEAGGSGAGGYARLHRYVQSGAQIMTPTPGAYQSTVPFDDAANFAPHCAGGASGNFTTFATGMRMEYRGGDGGSNGQSGGKVENISWQAVTYGMGGQLGGGNGMAASETEAGHATFFGGGGAGGYYRHGGLNNPPTSPGGNGHAGVVYIRIPVRPNG